MRSSHCDSYDSVIILVLNGTRWSTSFLDDGLLILCLCFLTLWGNMWAVHNLVITRQIIRLRSKRWSFSCISQYNISRLDYLWHPASNPWLISPTKGLRHKMLIELLLLFIFIIISTPKHTITFINNLVWFQLFLNLWKRGGIELSLLWSPSLIFTISSRRRIKRNPLLQLRLQLLWWCVLSLAIVDELDYLVSCSG